MSSKKRDVSLDFGEDHVGINVFGLSREEFAKLHEYPGRDHLYTNIGRKITKHFYTREIQIGPFHLTLVREREDEDEQPS